MLQRYSLQTESQSVTGYLPHKANCRFTSGDSNPWLAHRAGEAGDQSLRLKNGSAPDENALKKQRW
jgi:hypothetical protein